MKDKYEWIVECSDINGFCEYFQEKFDNAEDAKKFYLTMLRMPNFVVNMRSVKVNG